MKKTIKIISKKRILSCVLAVLVAVSAMNLGIISSMADTTAEYAYTVNPETAKQGYFEAKSDYEMHKFKGDLDGLKGVEAWSFMPDKNLDNNTTKYTGSFVFKSEDNSGITDICFDAYDNNWGQPRPGDMCGTRIKIYGSSDGATWGDFVYPTVTHTEDYSDNDGNNSCNHRQTMKYTFNAEDNIKYVRFEITTTWFTHKVCAGLRSFSYNTLKSETGYANFVNPETAKPGYFEAVSDYEMHKFTGNLDGLKDVEAYSFMPNAQPNDNTTKYTGAFIFKSEDNSNITDICFDAYDNNWGSPTASDDKGSRIKIYGSSDGATWGERIYPTVEHTEDYSDNNGNNSCNHRQTMKYTFNAEDNIKYVKFEIADTFFVHKVCAGLRSFAYNTDGSSEPDVVINYSENLDLSRPYSVTNGTKWDKCEAYTTEKDYALGYNLMGTEAPYKGVAGDVVFRLAGYVSDFQINVANGKDSSSNAWNGEMDFYVSPDNESWDKIEVDAVKVKGKSIGYSWIDSVDLNPNWASFWQYSGTLDTAKGYKYLKVSCGEPTGDNAVFRQLLSVKYNFEKIPVVYSAKLNLSDPSSVSDGVIYGHVGGYTTQKDYSFGYTVVTKNDDDTYKSASGEVIYRFNGTVTDFRIAVGNSLNSAADPWSGYMDFYVSADNTNWNKIDVEPETVKGTDLGFSWKPDEFLHAAWGKFWQFKGTFNENDNYQYLKVVFVKGADEPAFRQFIGVDYNVVPVEKPTRYQFETTVTDKFDDFVTVADEGVSLYSPQKFNAGWGSHDTYVFHKGPITDTSTNEEKAAGSIVVPSKNGDAITDWKFSGVKGDDPNFAGDFKFYASRDNKIWDEISFVTEKKDSFFSPWGSFDFDFYGTLPKAEGYKYLKVTSVPGSFHMLPGFNAVLYNTENYDPDNLQPKESYMNKSLLDNYFLKDGNVYTFKSGTKMSSIDLHITESISDTPAITVFTEKDKDVLKTAVRRLVKDNGDGTGEYQYFDEFYDSENISQLKIDLTNAKFVCLNYNLFSEKVDTPRRHYTDVPVDESIKDLTDKSIFSDFSEGSKLNVFEERNAILGQNKPENVEYIGGRYGYGYLWDGMDYSVVMSVNYLTDFKLRVAYCNDFSFRCREVRVYARESYDTEEVLIPLIRQKAEKWASSTFQNYYLRPADRSKLAGNKYRFIRIEILGEENLSDWSGLMDFRYFYSLPEIESMPDFEKPAKGIYEIMDNFETSVMDVASGGTISETYNIRWEKNNISGFNQSDNVLRQDEYGAEAYVVYQYNGITGFDIRGYRNPNCTQKLILSVSPDGEDWTDIDGSYLEKEMYEKWYRFALRGDTSIIPEGTNYLRIAIPDDVDSEYALMISDIQLFYNNVLKVVEEEDITDTEEEVYEEEPTDTDEEPIVDETEEPSKGGKKKVVRYSYEVFEWWFWALIIGGSILAAGGITFLIIILVKKRKKGKNKV